MKRYAPPDEWRTNVAVGAEVEDFTADLPEEAARLAGGRPTCSISITPAWTCCVVTARGTFSK